MASVGGQKMHMPKILPKELWEQTGRWNDMGNELIRLKDRKGEDFCLAPTHEEIVTSIVANNINSHKQLPLRLYQIGDKYRDEARPRFGLLRAREFVMKDMYSFDATAQDAMRTYEEVRGAYDRIMTRLELPYAVAEADSGNIGGNLSHEFHALASVGEDTLLCCPSTGYYANLEKAKSSTTINLSESQASSLGSTSSLKDLIQGLVQESQESSSLPLRATLFTDPSKPGFAMLTLTDASYECNPYLAKSLAQLGADFKTSVIFDSAAAQTFLSASERLVVMDAALTHPSNSSSVKATIEHIKTVVAKDSRVESAHIKKAKVGDPEISGSAFKLEEHKGIEVGHLFYLGTKYSAPLKAEYMTKDSSLPMEMGCYGIGVSRLLAVAVETSHDDKGIIWPKSIAPYRVNLVVMPENAQLAQETFDILESIPSLKGEILLDDRKATSVGHRLKESEFIGIPYAVAIGNKFNKTGEVEVVCRKEGQTLNMKPDRLLDFFKDKFPSSL
jgi:prolyl-tRNA synthetase